MKLVHIIIAGKPYEIACDDGQEDHLRVLAETLGARVSALAGAGKSAGDAYLLVLAGLMLADELRDKTRECDQLQNNVFHSAQSFETNKQIELENAIAATLSDIATRIDTIAETLEKVG